jgi:hypothetical protein
MTKVQDPDLYEQVFAPHASEEVAKSSLETFIEIVQKARIEHGISDFVIAATANCSVENETRSLIYVLARGDSHVSAELAAQLFKRFALPEIQRAKHLEQLSRESVPEQKEKE